MGVLQRLALVYLISAVLFLKFNWRGLSVITISLLLFYWLVMRHFPLSFFMDHENFSLNASLAHGHSVAAYVDSFFLGTNHVYYPGTFFPYDPEGFLIDDSRSL